MVMDYASVHHISRVAGVRAVLSTYFGNSKMRSGLLLPLTATGLAACDEVLYRVDCTCSLGPRRKPTPAWIASHG